MSKTLKSLVLVGAAVFAQAATAGVMYVSDGDGMRLYAVNTDTGAVNTWSASPRNRAFPIAVYGDVRTTGYYTGETGGQYSLSGALLGNTYALPQISRTLSDGTTDGKYNYGISWQDGSVYRFDREWAHPDLLFTTGSGGGLTYDAVDNTFWMSCDRCDGVRHYSLTGALLGAIATPQVASIDWDLAIDPTNHTLWMSRAFGGATFYQYATDGTFLGSHQFAGLNGASSFFSAEFDEAVRAADVPEPGSLALIAIALGAAAVVRRRS